MLWVFAQEKPQNKLKLNKKIKNKTVTTYVYEALQLPHIILIHGLLERMPPAALLGLIRWPGDTAKVLKDTARAHRLLHALLSERSLEPEQLVAAAGGEGGGEGRGRLVFTTTHKNKEKLKYLAPKLFFCTGRSIG